MKLINQIIAIIAFLLFSFLVFAADTEISNLVELTTPAANDELAIVDTSGGGTKKIAYGNPIQGDDVSRQVLRSFYLRLQDGTNANTVKAWATPQWNGDLISLVDNIAGGSAVGDFYLSSDGEEFRILSTGLTGNCIGVVCSIVRQNSTNTHLTVRTMQYNPNGIKVYFHDAPNDSIRQDIRLLVDNGIISATIIYVTDE